MDHENQIKILSELEERFSLYRSEHSGKKLIVYSKELKELVRSAVALGVSLRTVAEVCKVSNGSVRDWTKRRDRFASAVKKLEIEAMPEARLFEYARLQINNRFVIEIPVAALLRELDLIAGYK